MVIPSTLVNLRLTQQLIFKFVLVRKKIEFGPDVAINITGPESSPRNRTRFITSSISNYIPPIPCFNRSATFSNSNFIESINESKHTTPWTSYFQVSGLLFLLAPCFCAHSCTKINWLHFKMSMEASRLSTRTVMLDFSYSEQSSPILIGAPEAYGELTT